jgi:hypothetical protein
MNENCYIKPSWTHNSSVRTDLPMIVFKKAKKKEILRTIGPGQLVCVGKVFFKTHNGLVQIK